MRQAGPRRRSLRQNKLHLLDGESKDTFAKFHQLRQKHTTTSAPLMSADGSLLPDKVSGMAR